MSLYSTVRPRLTFGIWGEEFDRLPCQVLATVYYNSDTIAHIHILRSTSYEVGGEFVVIPASTPLTAVKKQKSHWCLPQFLRFSLHQAQLRRAVSRPSWLTLGQLPPLLARPPPPNNSTSRRQQQEEENSLGSLKDRHNLNNRPQPKVHQSPG